MAKLLVFAPCEKVIIAQDDNNPTLVAVLSQVRFEIERGKRDGGDAATAIPPERIVHPMKWAVFTMWRQEAGDEGRSFLQRLDITDQAGTIFLQHSQDFKFLPGKRAHRITLNVPGFPVAESGEYMIRLYLDDQPVAEYGIEVVVTKPQPVAEPQ